MTTADIRTIYDQHIKPLSPVDRRRLLEILQREVGVEKTNDYCSILDLEGLGAELWQGIEAQEYINSLRNEWDHR